MANDAEMSQASNERMNGMSYDDDDADVARQTGETTVTATFKILTTDSGAVHVRLSSVQARPLIVAEPWPVDALREDATLQGNPWHEGGAVVMQARRWRVALARADRDAREALSHALRELPGKLSKP